MRQQDEKMESDEFNMLKPLNNNNINTKKRGGVDVLYADAMMMCLGFISSGHSF